MTPPILSARKSDDPFSQPQIVQVYFGNEKRRSAPGDRRERRHLELFRQRYAVRRPGRRFLLGPADHRQGRGIRRSGQRQHHGLCQLRAARQCREPRARRPERPDRGGQRSRQHPDRQCRRQPPRRRGRQRLDERRRRHRHVRGPGVRHDHGLRHGRGR